MSFRLGSHDAALEAFTLQPEPWVWLGKEARSMDSPDSPSPAGGSCPQPAGPYLLFLQHLLP